MKKIKIRLWGKWSKSLVGFCLKSEVSYVQGMILFNVASSFTDFGKLSYYKKI